MEKMNILEYLAFEDNVTPGLKETLKKIYFKNECKEKEAVVTELEDGSILCTFVSRIRGYVGVTNMMYTTITSLKLDKNTGTILDKTDEVIDEPIVREEVEVEKSSNKKSKRR